MKQTSVEWLIEKLKNVEYNPLQKNGYSIAEERLFNQAKEMEKEQIIIAYNQGCVDTLKDEMKRGKQYYNETYKK